MLVELAPFLFSGFAVFGFGADAATVVEEIDTDPAAVIRIAAGRMAVSRVQVGSLDVDTDPTAARPKRDSGEQDFGSILGQQAT
ncbi:MAG: hypothetical protein QOH54_2101 [Mycobacterium sp.]|nr:hypothetical protein [Mycobacterium sp.]